MRTRHRFCWIRYKTLQVHRRNKFTIFLPLWTLLLANVAPFTHWSNRWTNILLVPFNGRVDIRLNLISAIHYDTWAFHFPEEFASINEGTHSRPSSCSPCWFVQVDIRSSHMFSGGISLATFEWNEFFWHILRWEVTPQKRTVDRAERRLQIKEDRSGGSMARAHVLR